MPKERSVEIGSEAICVGLVLDEVAVPRAGSKQGEGGQGQNRVQPVHRDADGQEASSSCMEASSREADGKTTEAAVAPYLWRARIVSADAASTVMSMIQQKIQSTPLTDPRYFLARVGYFWYPLSKPALSAVSCQQPDDGWGNLATIEQSELHCGWD